jgi:hypothetical protein
MATVRSAIVEGIAMTTEITVPPLAPERTAEALPLAREKGFGFDGWRLFKMLT